ncbi:3',5'-cyclic-nucleotide phosphodiesterase (PDEase) (3':5'-CNP) [Puccinia graminis f. sp. tritici]|uniref:3',5'-cyclic-nucleotide phosphodiesterase (PDEase) (3':5'-CNP) n=1 Tax=Puccinia graminis f. sp. tritici TaxID=56615 RepID=A0A5B0QCW5_PUCGR|nr:3',5'-cyclic-nucleotide phosphodiesterase (PDEase) (3':5'-CNP) [Puccinia graminis f. sp. tritici]
MSNAPTFLPINKVHAQAKLSYGALADGANGIKEHILKAGFDQAHRLDIKNENRPPELIDAANVEGFEDYRCGRCGRDKPILLTIGHAELISRLG